jgi:membrane protein
LVDVPQEAGEPEAARPPAQTITGWRKTFDRVSQRVLSNVVIHTTLRVIDTANQAGAGLFASALAFTTLFAVVPLFLLLAGVLGWVIEDAVQRSELLDQLVSYFPPLADAMSTSLETIVSQRGTLSILGLIGLLWGASSYYAALDEVMRRLFAADHVRGFFEQRLRGVITVGVLIGLMLGTIVLSSLFTIIGARVGVEPLVPVLLPLAALTVIVVVVLAVYLFVPAAPPSWRAALPPALVAGVGIGILTNIFSLLTPWLIGGLLAFGVIATVFGVLIWLSLSYQILLFGAAWARVRRDAEIRRGIAQSAATPYAD